MGHLPDYCYPRAVIISKIELGVKAEHLFLLSFVIIQFQDSTHLLQHDGADVDHDQVGSHGQESDILMLKAQSYQVG